MNRRIRKGSARTTQVKLYLHAHGRRVRYPEALPLPVMGLDEPTTTQIEDALKTMGLLIVPVDQGIFWPRRTRRSQHEYRILGWLDDPTSVVRSAFPDAQLWAFRLNTVDGRDPPCLAAFLQNIVPPADAPQWIILWIENECQLLVLTPEGARHLNHCPTYSLSCAGSTQRVMLYTGDWNDQYVRRSCELAGVMRFQSKSGFGALLCGSTFSIESRI